MSNKELKFSIVVDPRTAGEAKRVIRELISDAEKLAKTLSSVNLGGHGGGLLSGGSVGGAQTQGTLLANAQAPKQTGPVSQNKSLAQMFLDSGKGLKDLANISQSSMRVMSDGIKRAVDEEKRSLADLDNALNKLARRYDEVSQARKLSEASGSMPQETIDRLRSHEDVLLGRQQELLGQREKTRGNIGGLAEQRRQMAINSDPYSQLGGPDDDKEEKQPGWLSRKLGAGLKGGARFGVVAGSIAAGVMAGAGEMQAAPFDYVTQQARQAQALGTLGVATRSGDLKYSAAMMQIFNDPEKRKEFGGLGNQNWSTGITQAGGAVLSGVTRGDFNAPGNIARGIESIPTAQKERLRQYIDEQIKTDPRFFANLDRFQGEADARVGMMRRMGYGEKGLSKSVINSGEDMSTIGGAFEAVRGGGRGFAQAALWQAMRAQRGGMDMGAAGSVLVAGSMTGGSGGQILNAITQNNDVVAAEHLGRAIVTAMQSSSMGISNGLGVAGALTGSGPMSVYQAQQGMGAVGAMTSGGDAFGSGVNVLNALKIAGPGGDIYHQQALVELMKPENTGMLFDAMAGQKNDYLKSMLGDNYNEEARQMFQGSLTTNVRARQIDQGKGTKLTPASKRMQDIVTKYNGDIRAYMDDELSRGEKMDDLTRDIGSGLHQVYGEQFSVQAGEAGVRSLYNAGNSAAGKSGLGDASGGSAAGTYRRERNKTNEEELSNFVEQNKNVLKTLSGGMKSIADVFDRMKDTDVSANHASKSLLALADAADQLTIKWHGKVPNDSNEQLDALRRSATDRAEAGGTKGISKNMAASLWKGYKTTGSASPEALAAFKQYGFTK